MTATHAHRCQPLWIAGLGAVATCGSHWMQPVALNQSAPKTGTR